MRTINGQKKLTREFDLYIKQNYLPEGFKLKDFIGAGAVRATIGTPMGGAKWALSFLLDKLEMTFSEKLIQLIEKKGRKPAEVYTKFTNPHLKWGLVNLVWMIVSNFQFA